MAPANGKKKVRGSYTSLIKEKKLQYCIQYTMI